MTRFANVDRIVALALGMVSLGCAAVAPEIASERRAAPAEPASELLVDDHEIDASCTARHAAAGVRR